MSGCTVRGTVVIGLILASAAAVAAPDDDKSTEPARTPYYGSGGSTLTFLLTKPGVQKELGLGESESKKLMAALQEIDPKHIAFQTPEERRQGAATREETQRKLEAAMQKFLSEKQFRRFQQLEAQYLGGRALLIPKFAEQFALSAEQQEKLKAIREQFGLTGRQGAPRLSDEEASVRFETYQADLLAVLTPGQTNQWKAMTGDPFRIPKSFSGPSWRLVLVPEVQKELGLSEDDTATLVQSLNAIQLEGFRLSFRANPADRAPADQMRQSQQIIDTTRSSLTVSQWNRLQELILQEQGVESFAHHEVAKQLGLSREQRDRVRETMGEYRKGLTGDRTLLAKPKELQARREKEQAGLLDILTADQKKQWEAMQGAKGDPDLFGRPRISPAGE